MSVWPLLLGLAAVACAFLASCSPATRLNRLASKAPLAAAGMCARMYPVRESVDVRIETRTDTQYRSGPVVFVDCDSANARRYPGDTSRLIVAAPCPPARLIRTLVTKDSIVRIENTAALYEARSEARSAELQVASLTKSRQIWRLFALILFAYTALRLVAKAWLKVSLP